MFKKPHPLEAYLITPLILILGFAVVTIFTLEQWVHAETPSQPLSSHSPLSSDRLSNRLSEAPCFDQRLRDPYLSIEINELDRRISKTLNSKQLPTQWRGINLSTFTLAQREFLQKQDRYLGVLSPDNALQAKQCTELTCILELYTQTVEDNPDRAYYTSLFIYGLHLWSGVTVNLNPALKSEFNPLGEEGTFDSKKHLAGKDLFFDVEEMEAIYKLIISSDDLFKRGRFKHFEVFIRTPRGLALPGMVQGEGKGTTFFISDGCVSPRNYTQGSGNSLVIIRDEQFKSCFTHEFIHAIDEDAGDLYSLADHQNISASAEWKNLSGWYNTPFFDENRDPLPVHYLYDKDKAHFVTHYSRSYPWEDFAESVTYFRYFPDTAKQRAPEKYEWIKRVLFNGETFSKNETKTLNRPEQIERYRYHRDFGCQL
jgi:hypothetical protein